MVFSKKKLVVNIFTSDHRADFLVCVLYGLLLEHLYFLAVVKVF